MLLKGFQRGKNSRLHPSLLDTQSAEVFHNIDNSEGTLKPLKLNRNIEENNLSGNPYYFRGNLVDIGEKDNIVEYNNRIYGCSSNSTSFTLEGSQKTLTNTVSTLPEFGYYTLPSNDHYNRVKYERINQHIFPAQYAPTYTSILANQISFHFPEEANYASNFQRDVFDDSLSVYPFLEPPSSETRPQINYYFDTFKKIFIPDTDDGSSFDRLRSIEFINFAHQEPFYRIIGDLGFAQGGGIGAFQRDYYVTRVQGNLTGNLPPLPACGFIYENLQGELVVVSPTNPNAQQLWERANIINNLNPITDNTHYWIVHTEEQKQVIEQSMLERSGSNLLVFEQRPYTINLDGVKRDLGIKRPDFIRDISVEGTTYIDDSYTLPDRVGIIPIYNQKPYSRRGSRNQYISRESYAFPADNITNLNVRVAVYEGGEVREISAPISLDFSFGVDVRDNENYSEDKSTLIRTRVFYTYRGTDSCLSGLRFEFDSGNYKDHSLKVYIKNPANNTYYTNNETSVAGSDISI